MTRHQSLPRARSPPPAPAELATGSVTVASGPVASGGVTSGMVGPVTGAATTVTVTPAAGTTRTASEMTSGSNDPPHGHGRRGPSTAGQ